MGWLKYLKNINKNYIRNAVLNSPHSPVIEKENKGKVVDEVPH